MFSKISKRDKIILVSFLTVLVVAGFGYFILSPQLKAHAQVKEELNSERTKLLQAQTTASSHKAETDKLALVKGDIAETGRRFAIKLDDGSDVIFLGIRSASQNVLIKSIEPGDIKENPHSLELPLKVEVEGNFRSLISFCRDLDQHMESLFNLSEIRNIKIETAAADFAPGGVKAVISMVIYSAKNPDEKLNLEQISRWLTGRHNVFRPAVFATPIPELAGRIHTQTGPPGSVAGSKTGGIVSDQAKPGSPPGGTAKPAGPAAGTQNPVTIDRAIADPGYVQRK